MLMQWHITDRCNLRCTHCYRQEGPGEDLPIDKLKDVLHQFNSLLDSISLRHEGMHPMGQINITGGEPLVREDFFAFLNLLREEAPNVRFAVLTNGTMIDADRAKRLASLSPEFVQVSLDGTHRTHDAIRGQGTYSAAMAGLKHLRAAGVRTMISFTAHQGNFREFPAIVKCGTKVGADKIWTDRLVPIGGGEDMRPMLLTMEQTREYVNMVSRAGGVLRCLAGNRPEIGGDRALHFLGGGVPYRCHAGGSLITIMANGDVVPCRRMPIRVGNVLEQRLTDIYFDNDLLTQLRDRSMMDPACAACMFSKQCGGGLRCLSNAIHNDPFIADPGCWLAEEWRGQRGRTRPSGN